MLRFATTLMAAAILAAVLTSEARADSFTIVLDGGIVGQPSSPTPSGSPTITFTDTGTDEVTITMSLGGMSGSEKLKEWYFNSAIDPTGFTWTHVSGDSAAAINTVFNSTSDWKADGTGGYHDIRFDFSPSGSAAFKAGDADVVYRVTGSGLTAADFNTYGITSSAGGEVYRSVAHVLGLSGGASIWVGEVGTPVPEPSTALLMALGVGGIALLRRRGSSHASA